MFKRIFFNTAFLIFLLLSSLIFSAPNNWNSVIVSGGGFVDGIVYHPSVSGLAYARTDMGGAYRRDAAGSSWTAITDSLNRNNSDYMGILSIAVDPNDGNRVYLECGKYTASWAGSGAVLSSTDRGNTWTINAITPKIGGNEDGRGMGERLAVDPNKGSILLMGTTANGLWQSTNYGAAWTQIAAFAPVNVNFVIFDKTSGTTGNATQRIFAGVNDITGNSLYMSTNGGTSWNVVAGQPAGYMAGRADIAGGFLYTTWQNAAGPNGAGAGAVYKYNIATPGWTNISPVMAPAYGYGCISVDAQNTQHIIVSTLDLWWPKDQVWQSTNGGNSWNPLIWNTTTNADLCTFDNSLAPWSSIRNIHWLNCIKIDPFNSTRAEFGTGYGIFACDNTSAAAPVWQFRNLVLEEMVPIQLAAPPSGTLLFSACGDQGVFRHDVLTTSPAMGVSLNVGSALSVDYAESKPNTIVAAYNSPSPFGAYSINSGTTWTNFAAAPGGATAGGSDAIAISPDGKTIVWAPVGAAISYSTNAGGSWTACGGGVPAGDCPVSDRVNGLKFYVYDPGTGKLWYSNTGGASFTQSATAYPTLPSYQYYNASAKAVFGKEGDVWITTGAGGLYRSTDSGVTGNKINTVTEAYMIGFGKSSGGAYPSIYLHGIVGGALGIFRSDDTGATWTRINDDAHQYGFLHDITGDKNIYGRCYISAEGRGVIYGDLAAVGSPTYTPTATRTNTPVLTNTFTLTCTRTNTPVLTSTFTVSYTRTYSPTNTNTSTTTSTPVNTPTFTLTPAGTLSFTPTRTNTPSSTSTYTATSTPTSSFTATPSRTNSNTPTFTLTATGTPSYTGSPTSSVSPTETLYAGTPTDTFTATDSPTITPTGSMTVTGTRTVSMTATFTHTDTPVSSSTNTPVTTFTSTPAITATNTPVSTATNTPVNTATNTAVNTSTNTPVNTSTQTQVSTLTSTKTMTPTSTRTATNSPTLTATPTYTRTFTPLPSATATYTAVETIDSPVEVLNLWPNPVNPANSELAILMDIKLQPRNAELLIYSRSYRLIRKIKLADANAGINLVFVQKENLESLSNGIYYYVVNVEGVDKGRSKIGVFVILR
jgi:hypothetical protein